MQIFPSKGSIPDNCPNDTLTSFLELSGQILSTKNEIFR